MQAQAAAWRAVATRVADDGARAHAAVTGAHFEGPAATRARAEARAAAARATGIAAELRALAGALSRDAEELDVAQRRERAAAAERRPARAAATSAPRRPPRAPRRAGAPRPSCGSDADLHRTGRALRAAAARA